MRDPSPLREPLPGPGPDGLGGAGGMLRLSVVIPLYNEVETLPELQRRLVPALESVTPDFEVLFVDDGSSDGTARALETLAAEEPRVKVLALSRNFGHQTALSAGIDHASGDAVVLMDGDLQDPPEFVPDLVAKWREGWDVVYAVKENRKEGALKRAGFRVFYTLLRRLSSVDAPLDAGIFCVMGRRTVELLRSMPERNRYISGLRAYAGGRQTGLRFERGARWSGTPRQTPGKLTRLALDALLSFSYVPLRLASYAGFAASALAFLSLLGIVGVKLFTDLAIPGWASVMSAVLFLGGVQLVTVGIMGEYIGRIFDEVKGRPYYVVDRRIGFTGVEETAPLRERDRLPDRRRAPSR